MVTKAPDVPAFAPAMGSERLTLIDSLRGFALAGVLLVNVGAFTLYFFLDPASRAALPTTEFDTVARWFHRVFIERKAITLFSLLFGLGFAIQLKRAEARGNAGLRFYVRRLCVLFGIGLIHAAFIWWGDVLLMYALLGLLLIVFRDSSDRVLVLGGLLVAIVLPPLLGPSMEVLTGHLSTFEAMKPPGLQAFGTGDYPAVVRQNVVFGSWTYAGWWDDWFLIFGRFLLGYWAGRRGIFHHPAQNRNLIAKIFVIAAIAGVVATAIELRQVAIQGRVPVLASGAGGFLLQMVVRSGSLGLGIAYATGIALLFLQPPWRRRIETLAPVGRMALTNYITHSLLGVAIFYGIGFGVGPGYGYVSRIAFAVTLFGLQILVSRWWLARFRFGPLEWLWRNLTYGRLEPMKAASQSTE